MISHSAKLSNLFERVDEDVQKGFELKVKFKKSKKKVCTTEAEEIRPKGKPSNRWRYKVQKALNHRLLLTMYVMTEME